MGNNKQNKFVFKHINHTQMLIDHKIGCIKFKHLEYVKQKESINEIPFKSEILEYMKRHSLSFLVSMLPCPDPDYDRRDYYPGSIAYYMDDEYSWNSLDIYFLEKYNLELSKHFIQHVLRKIENNCNLNI